MGCKVEIWVVWVWVSLKTKEISECLSSKALEATWEECQINSSHSHHSHRIRWVWVVEDSHRASHNSQITQCKIGILVLAIRPITSKDRLILQEWEDLAATNHSSQVSKSLTLMISTPIILNSIQINSNLKDL